MQRNPTENRRLLQQEISADSAAAQVAEADGDGEHIYAAEFEFPRPEASDAPLPPLTLVSQNIRGMGHHVDSRNQKMVHIRTSVQTKAQQTDIVFLQELQWMQDPREMLKRTFQEYNIH
ncbi:hypothetical protein H4S02_013463, partial [Coemansia sp. RSA 2611]